MEKKSFWTVFKKVFKYTTISLVLLFMVFTSVFIFFELFKKVPTEGDWKDTLKVLSTAEFHQNLVTVRSIRNFQYDSNGNPTVEAYYDKTYDLNKLKKVWYVTDPFSPGSLFAHTFLSFEFSDGSFLAITIEGRLKKGEEYSLWKGTVRTFPLMYIAADERDVIYLRANQFKDGVYVYPLKATPDQGRILLVDMLNRMNDLLANPDWYNSIFANCTSSIANHVNKIWPGLLPKFDWQVLLTSYADQLALDRGLLDTDLSLAEARKKFYVTDIAQKVGYVDNYSLLIRQEPLINKGTAK